MIIAILVVLGLCLGSFVNALVYRLHMQAKGSRLQAKGSKKHVNLSILNGRSVCVHCGHELAWHDLVPVLSWLSVKGRCRYCHKPVSAQYPVVELATAGLFVLSYAFWPDDSLGLNFAYWLVMLTGLVALLVYDLKWMILPNRIVYFLLAITSVYAVGHLLDNWSAQYFGELVMSVIVGGGLFLVLFQISSGRWIGGGDVKLGLLAGLLLADPYQSFLVLFFASMLGTLVVLPGLLAKKIKSTSRIPFGPFLVVAIIVVKLFGASLIEWYKRTLAI